MGIAPRPLAGPPADGLAERPHASTAGPFRWLVLAIVWFAFLLSFVDRLIWTSVGNSAAGAFGLNLAALALFVTAFYAGYVVSSALSGFASDRVGPRLTIAVALLLLGAATFGFGSARTVAAGVALQALMGFAGGADFAAGVKLIIAWFGRRDRGRAMGIFMTATSMGVVVINALAPRLMQVMSWPDIYRAPASSPAPSARSVGSYCATSRAASALRPVRWTEIRALARNRQFLYAVGAGLGGVWGTWGFAIWANALMIRGLHFAPVLAGSIVATFGVVAVVSKPLIGVLSDSLGGRKRSLVMIDLLAFSALLLITGFLTTETQLWIVAPFLGAAAFAYSPLQNTMAAEAAGAAAGSAAGISNAIGSIGTTIVPIVVGIGFQATQSYKVAFAILCGWTAAWRAGHGAGPRPLRRRDGLRSVRSLAKKTISPMIATRRDSPMAKTPAARRSEPKRPLDLNPERAKRIGRPHYAIVDIGSNSVRLVVYDQLGRAPLPRFNEKSLCRLGERLAQTGAIQPDNFRRTIEAMRRFRAIADAMGVTEIDATGDGGDPPRDQRARARRRHPQRIGPRGPHPVGRRGGALRARSASSPASSGRSARSATWAGAASRSSEALDDRVGDRWVSLPLGALPVEALLAEGLPPPSERSTTCCARACLPALGHNRSSIPVGGGWRAIAKAHMTAVGCAGAGRARLHARHRRRARVRQIPVAPHACEARRNTGRSRTPRPHARGSGAAARPGVEAACAGAGRLLGAGLARGASLLRAFRSRALPRSAGRGGATDRPAGGASSDFAPELVAWTEGCFPARPRPRSA